MKAILNTNVSLALRVQSVFARRFVTTDSKDALVPQADETPVFEVDDFETLELDRQRNKSRLEPQHRNMLLGQKPYNKSIEWYHNTVRYQKRILGRYGMDAVGIPAGFAWPTPEEVADAKEYERVAFPLTMEERWKKIKEAHVQREEKMMAREAQVSANMAKMDKWIAEVKAKVAKKEAEIEAARKRKERLIEEVRRHFGFKISPNEDRFKELLAQKEKQEKKKLKEARKLDRQEKTAAKLAEKHKLENKAADDDARASPEPEDKPAK